MTSSGSAALILTLFIRFVLVYMKLLENLKMVQILKTVQETDIKQKTNKTAIFQNNFRC